MNVFSLIVLALALATRICAEPPEVSSEITRTSVGETVIHLSFLTVAPPEKLWKAITVPAELNKWVAPETKVELKVGGIYEYYFTPKKPQGKRGMEGTRIVSYIPGKMLSHSGALPETWVVWTIEPAGDQQVIHYYAIGTTQDWSDTASARVTGLTEFIEKLAKYVQP